MDTEALTGTGMGRRTAVAFIVVGVSGALYALVAAALGYVPPALRASLAQHGVAFRVHTCLGAVALVSGIVQMIRRRRDRAHRIVGRVYVGAVAVSGAAALMLAPDSAGGLVAHWGFGTLAVGWLATACLAFVAALRREFSSHRAWMRRSFALTCSGLTLRLELPLLLLVTGGRFELAYPVVAWLCWVPNLAYAWLRRG